MQLPHLFCHSFLVWGTRWSDSDCTSEVHGLPLSLEGPWEHRGGGACDGAALCSHRVAGRAGLPFSCSSADVPAAGQLCDLSSGPEACAVAWRRGGVHSVPKTGGRDDPRPPTSSSSSSRQLLSVLPPAPPDPPTSSSRSSHQLLLVLPPAPPHPATSSSRSSHQLLSTLPPAPPYPPTSFS